MSAHPYRGLPQDQFWSTSVAAIEAADLDPVRAARFTFSPADPVATAGSCFAQHIARYLQQSGYDYLQTETPIAPTEPLFSARYGNIYTVRQLHQLMLGAYGLHRPATRAWRRQDGRYIDPLRPQLYPAGFASADDVLQARQTHLTALRRVFQDCKVFIFTLGLTEAWLAPDGTALPVPPGVLGAETPEGDATFHNFTTAEMRQDMDKFLADLHAVNNSVRVILTVSPVPLVATYLDRNVLVSNAYSKAALRVVAEEATNAHANVDYFPSYEIITAPQAGGRYFEADLRSITQAGIDHVMRVFAAHTMRSDAAPLEETPEPRIVPSDEARAQYAALADVLCDEELLDQASKG
jgi:hypothetical protein